MNGWCSVLPSRSSPCTCAATSTLHHLYMTSTKSSRGACRNPRLRIYASAVPLRVVLDLGDPRLIFTWLAVGPFDIVFRLSTMFSEGQLHSGEPAQFRTNRHMNITTNTATILTDETDQNCLFQSSTFFVFTRQISASGSFSAGRSIRSCKLALLSHSSRPCLRSCV